MKNTIFYWGWQSYAPTPDKTMTRERMAKLMRAWRRSKTQGRRNFDFQIVDRKPGARAYVIATTGYANQDVAKIIICT